MSVIQKIRDKYARWAVVAIALSLLGFILMDAFAGRTGLFSGGRSNHVGSVDGTDIDYQQFARKVDATEKMRREQGQDVGEAGRQQIVQGLWDQEVNNVVLAKQYDELGLTVSEKELRDLLYGSNPPQDLKQRFTDPATGQYNGAQAQQFINQIRKQGTQQEKDQLNQYLENLAQDRLMTKYTSILANSIHFPKWFIEKTNVDQSMIARVSYVSVPYSSISDSTVKVSDNEIKAYIDAHKKNFDQKEETRNISYVSFPATPNASDSAATRNALLTLKPQFDTVTKFETFLNRNSTLPFYNGLIGKSVMQQPNKDSILSAPTGVIYGPYLDPSQQGAQYVLSKIIESRSISDTVTVRHILVATVQQTEQGFVPVREDSVAKKLADSIATAIKGGANFDSMVVKFSDDPGSKNKAGVYENVTSGRMVPPFNDFIFTHSKGESGVVKTDFGYHYIEIMSTKGSTQGYKIAYLAKPIVASDETENAAQNAASMFAGESRNEKSFNDNWDKNLRGKGVQKLTATDIRAMDYSLQGSPAASRKFIKDIFEAGKGDVVGPERVGEAYVVAVITEINKPGLASTERVRPMIEPILRNKKKAEEIKKKIGTVNNLEEAAAKLGQQVTSMDSVRFSGGNNMLGYETKVLGAAFNPANKGKVVPEPIAGNTGVFVLRVDNTSTIPVELANIEDQRKMMEQQVRQNMMQQMQYGGGNPFVEPLKKAAKIKDNRANFY